MCPIFSSRRFPDGQTAPSGAQRQHHIFCRYFCQAKFLRIFRAGLIIVLSLPRTQDIVYIKGTRTPVYRGMRSPSRVPRKRSRAPPSRRPDTFRPRYGADNILYPSRLSTCPRRLSAGGGALRAPFAKTMRSPSRVPRKRSRAPPSRRPDTFRPLIRSVLRHDGRLFEARAATGGENVSAERSSQSTQPRARCSPFGRGAWRQVA